MMFVLEKSLMANCCGHDLHSKSTQVKQYHGSQMSGNSRHLSFEFSYQTLTRNTPILTVFYAILLRQPVNR